MSARPQPYQELALECLKIAATFAPHGSPERVREIAAIFLRFVLEDEPLSLRQRIEAALDDANVR